MHDPNPVGPLQLVDRLLARGVDCVIIGGLAVNYYGYLRATEDIDLVFRRTPDSELALWELLNEIAAYWISDDIDPATGLEKTQAITLQFVQSNSLMMLGSQLGYIDLFDFLPGFELATLPDFFDTAVVADGRKYVSLEWLKRLKLAANRPIDRIDLENLP